MNSFSLSKNTFLQAIGSRIICELNDLKRTPESAAKELNIPIKELHKILKGVSTEEQAFQLINRMGQIYPIDHTQMYLLKDDTINGARFMTSEESLNASRIYNRLDRNENLTPYYDYRDTAMSRLALFKPELIYQLRYVHDNDPYNPDMVLNKGHNMHQYGLFVGPVNFYYEDLDGVSHCSEMNTGDSNYITPFLKHSFTNRSKSKDAFIIACTSGCETARAQREMYALGQDVLKNYILSFRNKNQAPLQLIRQHMNNDMLTMENMEVLLREMGSDIDILEIFDGNREISYEEYVSIANVLNIEIGDIMIPKYKPEEDCVLKYISKNKPHSFPNNEIKLYDIHNLARTSKMPLLKGSIIDVISNKADLMHPIQKSLHSYMFNFSDSPINLLWVYDNEIFSNTVNPGDSLYLKPFIKYALGNPSNGNARMLVIGISGAVGLQAQRELSALTNPSRVINELEPWFEV
jgi:hypothetical protein